MRCRHRSKYNAAVQEEPQNDLHSKYPSNSADVIGYLNELPEGEREERRQQRL
jgi:hypothetical protein